jgi:repressor LexA
VEQPTTKEAVYLFVKDYIKRHTFPPSLREIGKGCFISTSAVTRHLDRLEWEGKLFREPGRARGITLVDENDQ